MRRNMRRSLCSTYDRNMPAWVWRIHWDVFGRCRLCWEYELSPRSLFCFTFLVTFFCLTLVRVWTSNEPFPLNLHASCEKSGGDIALCVCLKRVVLPDKSHTAWLNVDAGFFRRCLEREDVRNSAASALSPSSSWWQESEVTLSFKIYFPSISLSRHTLMLICGGMFSTGAWSKANTAGIFALWENTLWSHISSNRHLVALTWEKNLLFKTF